MPFEFARQEQRALVAATVLFPAIPDARMMLARPAEMSGRELLSGGTRAETLSNSNGVWLVRNNEDATSDALQRYLSSSFEQKEVVNFGAGIDVFEYSRPSAPK
jgi:hypothetical protein